MTHIKMTILSALFLILTIISYSNCSSATPSAPLPGNPGATLHNNPATAAFKAMLPLTLNMNDVNGNEKAYHYSTKFPINFPNHATFNTGDLMLWGNNSGVIFYKTFSTQYSYTTLGRVNNPAGLATALGEGECISSV